MPHRPASGSNQNPSAEPQAHRQSALQASALQRLALVAAPIAVLWVFVAFALDRFA